MVKGRKKEEKKEKEKKGKKRRKEENKRRKKGKFSKRGGPLNPNKRRKGCGKTCSKNERI